MTPDGAVQPLSSSTGLVAVEYPRRAYSGESPTRAPSYAWSVPWLTTRTMPSAGVLTAIQPGAWMARTLARVSLGSSSSGAVQTGWSAGSAMPSMPLAAQYGEPGPE